MSNIVEQLKLRRRHETVLRSGLKVGFHYPDIEDFILDLGQIPLPALAAGEQPTEEQALEVVTQHPDEMRRSLEFTRKVVASMLDDIDGEEVTADDDREAIVMALEPEDRQTLFLIATRQQNPNGANPGEA
jgi:hypothetical protein